MITDDKAAPPFDIFSLAEDVRERFGWSNADLNKVMEQLMPAAMSGFQYFGGPMAGLPNWFSPPPAPTAANPFAAYMNYFKAPTQQSLTPFFGPEAVQQALAAQISGITGLQSDAVKEMMPVAATLAFGQVARPFLQGEAQVLLDAYMRGFARGRPKRTPAPIDYLQGYTEAMNAFWGALLRPGTAKPEEPEPEEIDDEPEEDAPEAEDNSEFDEMVSGWMAAGRDLQSNQFKAFDNFFASAARNFSK